MIEDDIRLRTIRQELTKYHNKHGQYALTQPVLYEEIKIIFEKAFNAQASAMYKGRGLSKDDAFQDVIVHLLLERSGIPAAHIHTVYFAYFDRNLEVGEPYTLLQTRKAMVKIMRQSFLRQTTRTIAQNVLRRALTMLLHPPYSTHFEGDARRFTSNDEPLNQLQPLPSQEALRNAVRFASNVPKIPQNENAQRMNKVFHTQDLHLVLQIVLEHAPGLSISQFHKVFEDLLTDRPSVSIYNHEDMNLVIDKDTRIDDMGAESVALIRSVARRIWDQTDYATKVILSCQFSGLPDVKIAQNTSFDPHNPSGRMSRAWVTTKFTDFGKFVASQMLDLSTDDQLRVSRLIEAHIVNFDSEKPQ